MKNSKDVCKELIKSIPDAPAWIREALEERRQIGIARYGKAVDAFDGHDWLKEAQEECLDIMVYIGAQQTLSGHSEALSAAMTHATITLMVLHDAKKELSPKSTIILN
jgi:hypothetical protein